MLISTAAAMITDPKPCRLGLGTGGPPLSSQRIINNFCPSAACSRLQTTSTRPASLEIAPYLAAFVASSCSAIPMACDAFDVSETGGPSQKMRVPNRSEKWLSCACTRSASGLAFKRLLISRSWAATSDWIRSSKRSRRSFGLLENVR